MKTLKILTFLFFVFCLKNISVVAQQQPHEIIVVENAQYIIECVKEIDGEEVRYNKEVAWGQIEYRLMVKFTVKDQLFSMKINNHITGSVKGEISGTVYELRGFANIHSNTHYVKQGSSMTDKYMVLIFADGKLFAREFRIVNIKVNSNGEITVTSDRDKFECE
jgi:hypothetical protein